MARVMGYKACLQWIIDNDDTDWLQDDSPIISVTACLVADIFGKSNEEITRDLQRRMGRDI